MALSRKPKPQPVEAALGVDIDALINKGGTVATDNTQSTPENLQPERESVAVALRLPVGFEARIATARKGRAVKIPRHTWILEAISEKLEKEGF
jgi:hypothetical protein